MLLLIAQDDEGKYPWTPTMTKYLMLSTNWSLEEATAYLEELIKVDLVSRQDSVLTIRNGVKFNGKPRKDVEIFVYPMPSDLQHSVDVTFTPRQHDVNTTLLQSRVEKSRVEKSRVEAAVAVKVSTGKDLLSLFEETELKDLQARFASLDLSWEADKCFQWWQESKKTMKRPRTAFTNWLESALRIYQRKEADAKPGGNTAKDNLTEEERTAAFVASYKRD